MYYLTEELHWNFREHSMAWRGILQVDRGGEQWLFSTATRYVVNAKVSEIYVIWAAIMIRRHLAQIWLIWAIQNFFVSFLNSFEQNLVKHQNIFDSKIFKLTHLPRQQTGCRCTIVGIRFGDRFVWIFHVHTRPSDPDSISAYNNRCYRGHQTTGTVKKKNL